MYTYIRLLHTLATSTSIVVPESPNKQLRALRGSYFTGRFSRVRSGKGQGNRLAGHSLLRTVVTLTSMVLAAGLNVQLGALREQPQLRGSCFARKHKLRRPDNTYTLRKSAHALAVLGKVPGSVLMHVRCHGSTLVQRRLALAHGDMAKQAHLPSGIRPQLKSASANSGATEKAGTRRHLQAGKRRARQIVAG